jgi:hypothetical protein
MRILVTLTAALSLIAVPVSEASAKQHKKQHKPHAKHVRHVRHAPPNVAREPRYPDAAGWYPHDSSKLPFGSSIWWDQMLREKRSNGESP